MTGSGRRLYALSVSADKSARLILVAIVTILAVACAAGLWRVGAVLAQHVPLDPNEGWNAYHASSAMAGRTPYPDATGFMTNNYPPLSFYLVGLLGAALGDNIVAGRIVSLISFLAVGSGIAVLLRRSNCGRLEALFASLFFAGFLLLYSDYVGMDDPQLLGHALQICALLLLTFRKRPLLAKAGSAALFVTALFVKHNLIAMPLAATIWLSLGDWRNGVRLAAFMLFFGLVGLAACRLAFGFDILSRLNSPRSYSLSLFAANFRDWLVPASLPLAATLAMGTTGKRLPLFCAIYALVGAAIGGAILGGAGVDANAMFDADIALSLGAGVAVGRIGAMLELRSAFARPVLAVVLVVPLAVGLARAFDSDWLERDFWLHPLRDETELARSDIAYLRGHNGPALCEMLSLCYWAGMAATVDTFNLNQQFLIGVRDERPFIRLLDARAFSVIQLDTLSPPAFPAQVQAAVQRNYRVDRTNDEGVFLVPGKAK